MKTFKYISIALLSLLAFAGCVKETTDWEKGIDKEGAQIYIKNLMDTYYVMTAEEKADESADDDHISLPILRKVDNGDVPVQLVLILPDGGGELFSVETVSYKKDGVKATSPVQATPSISGDTLDISFTYPAGITELGLDINFDITAIESNKSYDFNAALVGETQVSSYGANSFEFSIMHSAPLHDPWVVIGKVKFTYQFAVEGFGEDIPDYNIDIAIFEHDFTDDSFIEVDGEKVINPDKSARKLKDQPYYRFCIPNYLYQMVAASLAEEDGTYDEEDLEYAKNSDGIMFYLDSKYDFTEVLLDAKNYPDPLCKDVNTAEPYTYFTPLWSYHTTTGTCDFNFCADYYYTAPSDYCIWFNPGYADYWDIGHSAAKYHIYPLFTLGGSPYSYGYGYDFEWLSNDLVSNWESFFTVDYNTDIDYTPAGEGTLKSGFKDADFNVSLYRGYDDLYKNDVYYLYAPYQEADYGIAVLVNNGKATLAANQPLMEQAIGKDIYVSQSDDLATSVKFNDKGEVESITLGMKIHYKDDDNAIMNVTDVFTPNAPAGSIESFLGEFVQMAHEFYYEPYEVSSAVTISRLEGNKVEIKGLIDSYYADPVEGYNVDPDCTITGEYDPNTNMIIIPAQYFKSGDDAATVDWWMYNPATEDYDIPARGYAYFQPIETDRATLENSEVGVAASEASACALTLDEDGSLVLTASPTSSYSDGYSVMVYVYDSSADSIDPDEAMYTAIYYPGYFDVRLYPLSFFEQNTAKVAPQAATGKMDVKARRAAMRSIK